MNDKHLPFILFHLFNFYNFNLFSFSHSQYFFTQLFLFVSLVLSSPLPFFLLPLPLI